MKVYKSNCREGIAFSTDDLEVNSMINLFCLSGSLKMHKVVEQDDVGKGVVSFEELNSGRYLCVIHSFRKTKVQLVELTED